MRAYGDNHGRMFLRSALAVGVLGGLLVGSPARPANAQTPSSPPVTVRVAVDTTKPGETISPVFAGLSLETAMLLPDDKGQHYFRPDNTRLVALFKSMGITCLRIGGNTADRATVAIPTTADIDSLYGFARAAGVKVIYTLRLKDTTDPADAAKTAKYIMDHYAAETLCLAIGNEPNVFDKTYPAYKAHWTAFLNAITAPDMAPNAKFCGPSATPGKTSWARDFANDFGKSGKVTIVTQHGYPGGAGGKVTDPAVGRDKMLSPDWQKSYESMYRAFVPAVQANGLKYRLEEINSFFNGGAANVSNTYASTLWGLDYLYWWASHGADGLNFHTGDRKAPNVGNPPMVYAAYETVSDGGYFVRPLGYATKAFDLGSHGRLVPVRIESDEPLNLTAYGVAGTDGSLYVTVINKTHGPTGRVADIRIAPRQGYARGSIVYLTEKDGDVAATSDVTLGGSAIRPDGTWSGTWQPLPSPAGDTYPITLPPASAAIVRLSR